MLPENPQYPYIIHVDGDVLKAIREKTTPKSTSIVRILRQHAYGSYSTYYADWINIHGTMWMETDWENPLHDRPNAICVIRTFARISFGTGKRVLARNIK